MRTKRTDRLRGAALVLAALSVLACSVLTPTRATPAAATQAATAGATSTARPSGTPRPSQTPVVFLTNTAIPRDTATPEGEYVELTFGVGRDETLVQVGLPPTLGGLDPALTTGAADGYIGHLFSGLVRIGPDLQVEPDLAESWVASDDGLVYTFTLRADAAFATGKALTAAEVQFSWERAADPATGSTTALTYLGDIAGVRAKAEGTADTIAGVVVVDDRTLVVTLEQPRTQFVAKLTYPAAFVVDPENVAQGERWMQQPNASGPFRLRGFVANTAMVFERNPGYHTPAGVPYVAYLFAPPELGSELYQTGQIDIAFLNADTAARVRDEADPLHAEWLTTTSLCTIMLRLDVNRPPLDDPQVRLALALSLDRAGLRDALSSMETPVADTILPPGLPGYFADQPRHDFDVNAAQTALAASRYAGAMPPIVLAEVGQPSALTAGVAGMWREYLGVEVDLQVIQSLARPAAGASLGHVVVYSWCADYPDPENFLEVLFHSTSEFNVSAYANPQVDAWLDEARADRDPVHRLDLYRQVEAQLLSEVAVIPWIHPLYERLVKPYVQGFVLQPMGAPMIQRVTLERTTP